MTRRGWVRRTVGALALVATGAWAPGIAQAEPSPRVMRARELIFQLELERAQQLLDAQGATEPEAGLELGRLLLYRTDYEQAAQVLERADVAMLPEGAALGALARDCARTMAGALTVRDDEHGVVVRMQDDRDAVLVPWIGETAAKARDALARDLGVMLPRPIRVELVRDHFALSSMTGLPEKSARTTGTVAVANWGRVAMVSPRATPEGYPWLDTLAHELTHLAIGRGSVDRAPLWLQEGIAKREETRWRPPEPSDDYPHPDSIAAVGFDRGIGLDLDGLGPSIAMLPTAEQAMVAFAEVHSFVLHLVRESGDDALGKVLVTLRDRPELEVGEALKAATGKDLKEWNAQWRRQVAGAPRGLPPGLTVGGPPPAGHAKAARAVRLAGLLSARGHDAAVVELLEPVRAQMPSDLRVRALLGKAWVGLNKMESAWAEVGETGATVSPHAEAYALQGFLAGQRGNRKIADLASSKALALAPWAPRVACEWLTPPALPAIARRAALCEAARRWP